METRYFRQITADGLKHTASVVPIEELTTFHLPKGGYEIEYHFRLPDGQSQLSVVEYDLSNDRDLEAYNEFLKTWEEETEEENWGIKNYIDQPSTNYKTLADDLPPLQFAEDE